tara:strand:- start:713 stop:907 length:195 start_codon:yes stop_codon:yes gene_type:complete
MIYVGDLVQYIHPLTASNVIGIVTDMMELEDGWPMYEVICTDPPDRGWYSDLSVNKMIQTCQTK